MAIAETATSLGWWWAAIYGAGCIIMFFIVMIIESITADPSDPSDHGGNSAAPLIALFWPIIVCASCMFFAVMTIASPFFVIDFVFNRIDAAKDARQLQDDLERLTLWAAVKSADPLVMLEIERMTAKPV